jgi:hypothetical protein
LQSEELVKGRQNVIPIAGLLRVHGKLNSIMLKESFSNVIIHVGTNDLVHNLEMDHIEIRREGTGDGCVAITTI